MWSNTKSKKNRKWGTNGNFEGILLKKNTQFYRDEESNFNVPSTMVLRRT